MTKDVEKKAKELTEKLLKLLEIEGVVSVSVEGSGEEGVLKIIIDAEDQTGLLIGSRGATLNAIQSFIAISLKQKTGDWIRVALDIGDWRQKQEDYLRDLSDQAVERAIATGEPQYLYNLTAAQRRIIHMFVSDNKKVDTHSEGEGIDRALVITSK